MVSDRSGLLVGKGEISKFLNNASDYMLDKFVKMGMPVVVEGNMWLAHKENIEEFFKHYSRKRVDVRKISDPEQD
jgi:2-phospho-L-lactate guanylyltransferase (CobY/MobA/RfbA family)